MARRDRHGQATVMEPAVLKKRVETALREGHKNQALEFARKLFQVAPEADNRALLARVTLEEAERLLAHNQHSQARAIASKAWSLVSTNVEKERLAEVLARSGNLAQAWLLSEQLANPTLASRILGHLADAAMRKQSMPGSGLPADFNSHKDAIIRAFAEVHAGNDEQAKTTLQAIGLTSPFLEWKVLLRGFIAYYQGDDAKALENWQRLNIARLPAQLAAPLRLTIDSAFAAAQSVEARARLHEMLDRRFGSSLAFRLRTVQRHLADERQLVQAFRQVQQLLPQLQAEAPKAVSRLANCFFWAIVDHGLPEDVQRYCRAFGVSPDDPELWRLEALAQERCGQFAVAHESWQAYEKGLAAHAAAFPPGHADRMRALVWRRMGENAARSSDSPIRGRDFPFNGMGMSRSALKPNAETCFKRSLELASDQLESHDLLMRHLRENGQTAKALKAGKQLLKQFPDHGAALEFMGELCLEKSDYAGAATYFAKAAKANPLDARLRTKLGAAHSALAEHLVLLGKFDEARDAFQAALSFREGVSRCPVLCEWAASEFAAGNASRAEELLQQALAEPGQRLAVVFAMLVLTVRLKLGKTLKARFDGEFNELLQKPADAGAAIALAVQLANFRNAGIKYVGQQTHEKKVLAYVDKARKLELGELQLRQLCDSLGKVKAPKLKEQLFTKGQRQYPSSPWFYLAEIEYRFALPRHRIWPFRVSELLDKVRGLSASLPPGERETVVKLLQDYDEQLQALNPFRGVFGGRNMDEFLGDIFGANDDDEDWDDN